MPMQEQKLSDKKIEVKIRKQQSMLICSGIAIILFGVWSIVKYILFRYMDPDHFMDTFLRVADYDESIPVWIYLCVGLIALLIDLLLRMYIGLSAISEGRGNKKKRITYVVIACLCSFIAIFVDITSIVSYITDAFDVESFLSVIVDISLHIANIEIVIAAIKLRVLNKKLSQ